MNARLGLRGTGSSLNGMTQADIDTRLLAKASRLIGQGFNRKVERMILVLGQLEIIILTLWARSLDCVQVL